MEKQGIEKVMEEFDEKFCKNETKGGITYLGLQGSVPTGIKSFLRSAIETAFKEVRPRGKEYSTPEKTINSLEHRRIDGFNEALSDYDQAVDKYLGK